MRNTRFGVVHLSGAGKLNEVGIAWSVRRSVKSPVFSIAVILILGGCGGAGTVAASLGGERLEVASLGVEPRYFGSDGTSFEDLQGQTVRALVSGAEYRPDSLSRAEGLVGLITFKDDGSGDIVFNHPNTSPWALSATDEPGVYERISSRTPGSDQFATLTRVNDVFILRIYTEYTPSRINYGLTYAAFGFETPIPVRPTGFVSYTGAGIIQISDNQSGTFLLSGTSMLDVDFAGGAVSGTLLHVNDPEIDLDGDGQFDDRLVMTLTLEDGAVDLYGIDGQVGASGEAYIGISPDPEVLDVTVTASGAEGAFYGPSAGSLGVVYDGNMTMALPDSSPVDYTFGGLTVVHQ